MIRLISIYLVEKGVVEGNLRPEIRSFAQYVWFKEKRKMPPSSSVNLRESLTTDNPSEYSTREALKISCDD
jgi:hypothetical protein